ncbi:DgyrCDS5551 [Dimorphilus gyrociliatus]|uniref:DgyrCDS5551 n=1 Tax=Dimorphilus gyrociliatus TaxID=2664684 RepID=A0A7I8VKC6_9ANNE|nr:DgyrCDS5551 [Dimorphilus gyrociliatus]
MAATQNLLNYEIFKYSSFSSGYEPQNILIDNPSEQGSRWSSDCSNLPQFITLKLEKPAIVTRVYFGKYEKQHVCNLKKFQIYGGLKEDVMTLLYEGGLRNNEHPEEFIIKHTLQGAYFPCIFIKIVPMKSHGSSFNFSIWHVRLTGINNEEEVKKSLNLYNEYREKEAMRVCLKHLRQNRQYEAYEALRKRTKIQLEHPLLTELYHYLVARGDIEKCERILEDACEQGLFSSYVSQQDYQPKWTPIETSPSPGMRGGHQMIVDPESNVLFLHGGWNGVQDLDDFWMFDLRNSVWSCLSESTKLDDGPSPRSCHKMSLDHSRRQIFMLGRYLDSATRTKENVRCEMFMFDLNTMKWTLTHEDTYAVGGPRLIFDHQMCTDSKNHVIYVFGGKILCEKDEDRLSNDSLYSGLYSYSIPNSTWFRIKPDCSELRSRICHSMVFHPTNNCLYIVGGHRNNKEDLSGLISYDINTDVTTVIECSHHIPLSNGYTQRATFNGLTNELHVLRGLAKDKKESTSNSFWIYNLNTSKWTCVYKNSRNSTEPLGIAPLPRYAHQLVFSEQRQEHFLFGGNPGRDKSPTTRLDDFWSLKLFKPNPEEILKKCRHLLRKQRYIELTRTKPIMAVRYLQNCLADSDHKQLKNLATTLFDNEFEEEDDGDLRLRLFDEICSFFPASMTQPKKSLVDLVEFNDA